jgi:hypothetical protein
MSTEPTHLVNMWQQLEAVASGAKALICQTVYGGAQAPPFRTIIYEMTSFEMKAPHECATNFRRFGFRG